MELFYDIPIFVLLVIAIYTDLSRKKVYNWTTIPAICLGLALHFSRDGWPGAGNSLLGFIAGFGLLFICYLAGGMGGGDVKLMGAIGALGGYPFVLWAAFYSALAGGLMAVIIMIWQGALREGLKQTGRLFLRLVAPVREKTVTAPREDREVPYGVAIVIGTFLVLMRKYFCF